MFCCCVHSQPRDVYCSRKTSVPSLARLSCLKERRSTTHHTPCSAALMQHYEMTCKTKTSQPTTGVAAAGQHTALAAHLPHRAGTHLKLRYHQDPTDSGWHTYNLPVGLTVQLLTVADPGASAAFLEALHHAVAKLPCSCCLISFSFSRMLPTLRAREPFALLFDCATRTAASYRLASCSHFSM